MEKRYRDYFRYLDKFELDVISEEEASSIRDGIRLQLNSLNLEMIRALIIVLALLICTCIFLSIGLSNMNVADLCIAAAFGVATAVCSIRYKDMSQTSKAMNHYIDKFSKM